MANQWQIPHEVEHRLRREFKGCAYCGRGFKAHVGIKGTFGERATIEHLNRRGPFYWSKGLKEDHLVIVCGRCNSSRGIKRLSDWFASPYCLTRRIGPSTVAARVQHYLRTAAARR
jgi:hypothetical protein